MFVVDRQQQNCNADINPTNYLAYMESLATKIKSIRVTLGLSQSEVARRVGVKPQAIQSVESGRIKSPKFIVELANVLGVSAESLLGIPPRPQEIPIQQIRVEGTSQAGAFIDISLIEDDEHERKTIPVPINQKYAHAHQYALLVAGDSMNKRFNAESYVHCAEWGSLGKELKVGMILHVERIKAASMVETTIKIYAERDGKMWLDPDSTNTKHLPIEINGGLDTEILIKGAVIGSYVEYEI